MVRPGGEPCHPPAPAARHAGRPMAGSAGSSALDVKIWPSGAGNGPTLPQTGTGPCRPRKTPPRVQEAEPWVRQNAGSSQVLDRTDSGLDPMTVPQQEHPPIKALQAAESGDTAALAEAQAVIDRMPSV